MDARSPPRSRCGNATMTRTCRPRAEPLQEAVRDGRRVQWYFSGENIRRNRCNVPFLREFLDEGDAVFQRHLKPFGQLRQSPRGIVQIPLDKHQGLEAVHLNEDFADKVHDTRLSTKNICYLRGDVAAAREMPQQVCATSVQRGGTVVTYGLAGPAGYKRVQNPVAPAPEPARSSSAAYPSSARSAGPIVVALPQRERGGRNIDAAERWGTCSTMQMRPPRGEPPRGVGRSCSTAPSPLRVRTLRGRPLGRYAVRPSRPPAGVPQG